MIKLPQSPCLNENSASYLSSKRHYGIRYITFKLDKVDANLRGLLTF